MGLACGEPTKHVRHRDPHMTDTRTTASLARLDGNDLMVVHGERVASFGARRSNVSRGLFGPRTKLSALRPLRYRPWLSLNGLGEGVRQAAVIGG